MIIYNHRKKILKEVLRNTYTILIKKKKLMVSYLQHSLRSIYIYYLCEKFLCIHIKGFKMVYKTNIYYGITYTGHIATLNHTKDYCITGRANPIFCAVR